MDASRPELIEAARRWRNSVANIASDRGLDTESLFTEVDVALENYQIILFNIADTREWLKAGDVFNQAIDKVKEELELEPWSE